MKTYAAKLVRSLLALAVVTALGLAVGCGTVRGLGEDISSVGEGISTSSEKVQDKMTGE